MTKCIYCHVILHILLCEVVCVTYRHYCCYCLYKSVESVMIMVTFCRECAEQWDLVHYFKWLSFESNLRTQILNLQ